MTLILRYVNISTTPIKIEEYFLEFLIVYDTLGKDLFNELVMAIWNLDLDISDVRGQGYDNGANIKGKYQGVQKRLLEIKSRAFYTPCGCHSLNLILCDIASSCPRALSFFWSFTTNIYIIFFFTQVVESITK